MSVNSILFPPANLPLTDATGSVSSGWYRWFLTIQNRTGGTAGLASGDISATATQAEATATAAQTEATSASNAAAAAQTTATTGVTNAATAQATASSALSIATTLNSTAVLKASFQADGVAPLADPEFTGSVTLDFTLVQAADDADAASQGIQVGGLYANGSQLMVRIS